MKEPGLDHRHRDKNGEISRKPGNTLVRTLRKLYGAGFAPGCADEEKLSDVLHKFDEASLSQLHRDHDGGPLEGKIRSLDAGQQRGRALLETLCGRCHAVGATGRSPHVDAPAFRTFGDSKLYDNDFGQRLQDGLTTIHPDTPAFRFSRTDAEAAVNYLKFLQEHKGPK